ncbi:MAG: alpha/beta hydrolase, partial [Lacinutrix venerupis]
IPTLYIMGEQDHLFLPSVKNIVAKHLKSTLLIIENCGHVVNVEQPETFNIQTIKFINGLA